MAEPTVAVASSWSDAFLLVGLAWAAVAGYAVHVAGKKKRR